jgi:hypothetical protein
MRRLLLMLSLAGFIAMPGTYAQTQQQTDKKLAATPRAVTETPPKSAAIRLDGLYTASLKAPDSEERLNAYLRFRADGTLNYVMSTLKAKEVADMWYHFSTTNPAARYMLSGTSLEITGLFGSHYQGALNGPRVKLVSSESELLQGEFSFVALQFIETQPAKTAPPPPETRATGSNTQAATGVQVTLGKAFVDNGCKNVMFSPIEQPVRYPGGTTQIAYQVILAASAYYLDLSVGITGDCQAPEKTMSRCNQYSIIDGRPIVTQWTSVLSCKDGKPFKPGKYALELLVNEKPTKTIAFEIK